MDLMKRGDHDTDSAYSGDGSNTDSGRGASEEGEATRTDHHYRPIGINHFIHSYNYIQLTFKFYESLEVQISYLYTTNPIECVSVEGPPSACQVLSVNESFR